ncbi:MAG: hypothetical protein K9K63_01755 [Desulfotignum sp.]|nr:hypothetical protein [Desulfotignum sp.]MCF8088201.1 hypothetical protein [Desulfotignum sp.]MCF8136016.1 hypothetical protein [Desulfotignum sp.]
MPFFNISDLIWDDFIYPRSTRKQQTIEAVLWQEQPMDYATCKDDMLLESARRNISHGDRLSQTDKRILGTVSRTLLIAKHI